MVHHTPLRSNGSLWMVAPAALPYRAASVKALHSNLPCCCRLHAAVKTTKLAAGIEACVRRAMHLWWACGLLNSALLPHGAQHHLAPTGKLGADWRQ